MLVKQKQRNTLPTHQPVPDNTPLNKPLLSIPPSLEPYNTQLNKPPRNTPPMPEPFSTPLSKPPLNIPPSLELYSTVPLLNTLLNLYSIALNHVTLNLCT